MEMVATDCPGDYPKLGTRILEEHVVTDLDRLSGRSVFVTIYLRHLRLMATASVDCETVAA